MKINADTNAADALKISKKVADIFKKHNLDCPGCKGIKEETIAKIAFNQGLELEKFINELNSALDHGDK